MPLENQFRCRSAGVRIQGTSRPKIDGNTFEGCGSHGIVMNDSPEPLIQGNTFSRNGSGALSGGVYISLTARQDLGGGARGSTGHNVFRDNRDWDLVNRSSNEIFARSNTWTHAGAATDRDDIYDDDESATSGRVRY